MLAAVIKGPTIGAALAEMNQAAPFADLFELRLDHFEEEAIAQIDQIISQSSQPLIFTFRKKEQGGARDIPENERLRKIERLLELHPAYCDIEADTDPQFIERIAKKHPNVKLIGSYHNFEETPEDLKELLEEMKNPHFSIYKIACFAQSTIDLLYMMIFARDNATKIPMSCISMGEAGQPSRILGPIVGNTIDYAGMEGDESVLFQYSLKVLNEKFHYRSLDLNTEIFALIGDPVAQSPGDQFHNEIFKKENRNAVYVKLRVKSSELPQFYSLFRRLPFKGMSVTIPLKEAIISLLDRIDPIAVAIGAVNTITIANRLTIGTNTDAPGALNAIERHLKVKGKRVAIVGAGGTARAIAHEAKKRGAHVGVFNRTYNRARSLASDLGVVAHHLADLAEFPYDLLVNTIPPDPEGKAPFDFDLIHRSASVMDVVYRPKETAILKAAKQRGCHCIYGEEMFIEQGRLQQIDWKKKYTSIEL